MIYSIVKHRAYIAHNLAAILLKLLLSVPAALTRENSKAYPYHKADNAHVHIERGQHKNHNAVDCKKNTAVNPRR